MLDKVEGIVLREVNYGDTSKIIEVFTLKYGLISLIAKGSRKLKSNISYSSNKLSYGVFNIFYKKSKISNLNSVDIINNFSNIKKDIFKISYASYLCDLVFQVVKQVNNENFEDIYSLFVSSLKKINEDFDYLVITNIFEVKMLDFLGVTLTLDKCSKCNSLVNIATISDDYNGLLCSKCLTNEKIYDLKVIKYLRMYYYLDIDKISKIDISNKIKNEIDDFLTDYYNKNTGIYLNSKKFLKDINKIKGVM